MTTVLANGCFDLLHVAHVRHLREASSFGDRLVVGLTRDSYIGKKGRPIIPEEERMEMLLALECVDDVFLCVDSIDALKRTTPDVFCKGHDYVHKGLLQSELDFCLKNNVRVRFTSENKQTTTEIIKRIKNA